MTNLERAKEKLIEIIKEMDNEQFDIFLFRIAGTDTKEGNLLKRTHNIFEKQELKIGANIDDILNNNQYHKMLMDWYKLEEKQ